MTRQKEKIFDMALDEAMAEGLKKGFFTRRRDEFGVWQYDITEKGLAHLERLKRTSRRPSSRIGPVANKKKSK